MDDSWTYILEYFQIAPPSKETLFYTFIVLFILISGFTGALFLKKRRKAEAKIGRDWALFYRVAEAYNLSAESTKLMSELIYVYFPRDLHYLLGSIDVFDQYSTLYGEVLQDNDREDELENAYALFEEIRQKYFLKKFNAVDNISSTRFIPPGRQIRLLIPTPIHRYFIHAVVIGNTRDYLTLQADEFAIARTKMKPNITFDGYYWRDGDAGYEFPMKIITVPDNDKVQFLHTDKFRRKQRRLHYRVSLRLNCRYCLFSTDAAEKFLQTGIIDRQRLEMPSRGVVTDLSGGGLSFFSNPDVEKGQFALFEILLKDNESFSNIVGKIGRSEEVQKRKKSYVEFTSIDKETQEAIIQYVSQKQLADKIKNESEENSAEQ